MFAAILQKDAIASDATCAIQTGEQAVYRSAIRRKETFILIKHYSTMAVLGNLLEQYFIVS
jgi:hypothetical protein